MHEWLLNSHRWKFKTWSTIKHILYLIMFYRHNICTMKIKLTISDIKHKLYIYILSRLYWGIMINVILKISTTILNFFFFWKVNYRYFIGYIDSPLVKIHEILVLFDNASNIVNFKLLKFQVGGGKTYNRAHPFLST